jgi:hypothetical protein
MSMCILKNRFEVRVSSGDDKGERYAENNF